MVVSARNHFLQSAPESAITDQCQGNVILENPSFAEIFDDTFSCTSYIYLADLIRVR